MATSWSEDESRIVDGFKLIHPHRRTKLSPAAVVLVDRSEDYFTALSCGGKYPLAHRIVNTLKAYQFTGGIQDSSSVTGQFGSLSVQHAATITPGNNCVNTARRISSKATQPLLSPMSGLTRLSFHLSPTLSYRYEQDLFFQRVCANNDLRNIAMEAGYGPTQHENNLTHLHILSGSEESGRDSLVANLKTRIAVEGGRIPLLKKHGLGAEVLAYVQALIESPGMGEGTPMKYSPRVCIQSGDMIGLALAVVEAMQRSSVKQFQTICDWKCSYDIRCSREAQLQQQLSRKPLSLDDCIESLHSQFESRCQRAKRKDIVKDKGDENNTVDAIHTITEIIR